MLSMQSFSVFLMSDTSALLVPMCTGHTASLLCIVTRLLISVLLHHRWEGGWYIRALSTRILVIFNDGNNNKKPGQQ